jgi:hypothetical protein
MPRKPIRKKPDLSLRPGATRVEVFNSGLEAWIYDEANAKAIVSNGLWRTLVDGGSTDGKLVGYGLRQDDSLCIDVIVGPALTAKELSAACWLEPQHALLRAPSGKLAVESNDSCRVAEEAEDRTDKGGRVDVPAGNYRLTLYRLDYEALAREEKTWNGAQQVIVLTPGGKAKDDARGLLPFKQAADPSWVGKVTISGSTARGLVWFEDYWDTYFANLDSASVQKLGLAPGLYLQTTVPATGHVLVTAFAKDWKEGAKLKPPPGSKLPEFGYGSLTTPQRWGNYEALFCRRAKAAKVVEDKHQTVWHEAIFEVLDAKPAAPAKKNAEKGLFAGVAGVYERAVMIDKDYFQDDELALCMKLDGRVAGVVFDESLPLDQAVSKLDAAMSALGLNLVGDFSFELPANDEPREFSVRAWGGPSDLFAAAWASLDSFEVFFYSRLASGQWLLTGTIDEDDAERISAARPRIRMQGKDEVSLKELLALHRTRLKASKETAEPLPQTLADLVRLFDDYVVASLG